MLAKALGNDYQIVEDGLNLRTTDLDGTGIPGTIVRADTFNGAVHLPASIVANLPLDLVVIMLGTNDLQARYNRQPVDIAKAAFALGRTVLASKGGVGTVYPAPKVLIVSPVQMATIPFAPVAQRYEGGQEKSKGFPAAFTQEAAEVDLPMIDAAVAIGGAVHGADGIHMTPSDHRALATALKPEIERLLNP